MSFGSFHDIFIGNDGYKFTNMYKWYTKERDLWIQVNSFEQKASPPPLPLIFPCFLQSFATLPLVHVQIWLNPASSAPISWSSGCCETCRELQLFSPQTLLTNNLTPSKMKSNLKIKKKKTFFSFISFKSVWVGFIVFRSGHFLGIPNGSGDLQTLYSQVCILCRWEIVRWNAQP